MNTPSGGLEGIVDNEEFYSLLNVPRNATADELKASYHKLCVLYHPDKQNESNQKNASDVFAKLQEAYSVLSDSTRRHIYDVYGKQGLEAEWQLIERKKTPQEFQVEYERIQRARAQQRLEELTHPEGSFEISINATSLFDNPYPPEDEDFYDDLIFIPEIKEMVISQSVQAPLTLSTTAKLSGNIQSNNGNGNGECSFLIKQIFSPKSWGEVEVGISDSRSMNLAFKGYRSFNHGIFGVARLPLVFTYDTISTLGITNPSLTVGRVINENLYTSLDLTTTHNMKTNLASSVVYNHNDYRIACKLQLGIPHSLVVTSFSYKLPEDASLLLNIKAGTFGAVLQYGAEHQLSEHSLVSAQVSVGAAVGVSLTLKLTRATHTYSLPIMLSDEINFAALFYGTSVPIALYSALQFLFIRPHQRREKERKSAEEEELMIDEINNKRLEAASLVSMMKETVSRKVEQERARRGLLIIEAWYGRFVTQSTSKSSRQSKICDVTTALQSLVEDSRLQLPPGITKSGIPGFYDPCPSSEKKLKISYSFQNKLHRCIVDDHDCLRIPVKSHLVEEPLEG